MSICFLGGSLVNGIKDDVCLDAIPVKAGAARRVA